MAFLGLLASGDVDENSVHDATDDVRVVSLTAGRYPADLVTDHDAEVDFISADDGARRSKRGLYPITIRRMDVRGEVIERHIFAKRYAPKFERTLIHCKSVGVDIPRPERDSRSRDCQPQMSLVPDRLPGFFNWHGKILWSWNLSHHAMCPRFHAYVQLR
jgi:hypothetical protein